MIGFALCGSFCNMRRCVDTMKEFRETGQEILPIMSETAYSTDTRFGKSTDFIREIEDICGRSIIHTIEGAEPIGPKIKLDALLICPCTGNTASKMAHGICDTAVTMAAKAHLRNERPLVIALATNDALSLCAPNIGTLLQRKNVYFVPLSQDDTEKKPRSMVCDFSRAFDTVNLAIQGKQIQGIIG